MTRADNLPKIGNQWAWLILGHGDRTEDFSQSATEICSWTSSSSEDVRPCDEHDALRRLLHVWQWCADFEATFESFPWFIKGPRSFKSCRRVNYQSSPLIPMMAKYTRIPRLACFAIAIIEVCLYLKFWATQRLRHQTSAPANTLLILVNFIRPRLPTIWRISASSELWPSKLLR